MRAQIPPTGGDRPLTCLVSDFFWSVEEEGVPSFCVRDTLHQSIVGRVWSLGTHILMKESLSESAFWVNFRSLFPKDLENLGVFLEDRGLAAKWELFS